MNLALLGMISGLDVLANAFVFSGALRSQFDFTEAASFSTALGWAAVLSAVMFGGTEQVVDHRKFLPRNGIGLHMDSAWVWMAVGAGCLIWYLIVGGVSKALEVALLSLVLGLRSVGRAVAYSRNRYWREAALTVAELALLMTLTWAGCSIFVAYLSAKLLGVPLRTDLLTGFPKARVDRSHLWSYAFTSIAPAVYFNIYYTALPAIVTSEVLVRFRFLQTLLVPMSFLGSLLARGRIVFAGTHERLIRVFDVPNTAQTPLRWVGSALLPAGISVAFVTTVAWLAAPMGLHEMLWASLYCTLIYHRAQLYSHITLRVGPAMRARVGLSGIALVMLSLLPVAVLDSPSVTVLYAALTVVEFVLLAISIMVLSGRRAELQT